MVSFRLTPSPAADVIYEWPLINVPKPGGVRKLTCFWSIGNAWSMRVHCTNYSHLIDCLDSPGAEIQMRRASPIYQLAKCHLSIGSRVYLKREQWEWLPLWILPNTWSHLITKLSRGMAPLSNPKIWAGQKRPSSVKGGSPKIFLFFHKVPLDMIYGGEIVKRGRWALKNGILALGVWSTMQAPCAVEKLWLTMSAPKQEC